MGVVDDLKAQIKAGKITFDSDTQKEELLGDNSGTKVTETLQKLALDLSKQGSVIRISSIIRAEGHHAEGKALDVGNEAVAKTLLPKVATDQRVSALSIDEIIFDAALVDPKFDRNKWNYDEGAAHKYDTATLDGHQDHIHFSVK